MYSVQHNIQTISKHFKTWNMKISNEEATKNIFAKFYMSPIITGTLKKVLIIKAAFNYRSPVLPVLEADHIKVHSHKSA